MSNNSVDSDMSRSMRPPRRRIRQGLATSDSDDDTTHDNAPSPQSQSPQEHVQRREPTLVCTTESVKLLVTLLSCLASPGKRETRIRCDVDQHGMLFTAHSKGKSLQIKTSLTRALFETYTLTLDHESSPLDPHNDNDGDDDQDLQLSFALNLTTLLECLSIFGPSALATTSLRMRYVPQLATLQLVVEDSGVVCECALQVLEHDDSNDVGQLEFEAAFEAAAVVGRCIIQSAPLHDAFAELYDLPSAASVTVAMAAQTQTQPAHCLSLSATSETGACDIAFNHNSQAFIECACFKDATATFHVAVLQQAFKALAHAHETSLRLNADGFLSIQHMVESGTGEKAFVDALISPEE